MGLLNRVLFLLGFKKKQIPQNVRIIAEDDEDMMRTMQFDLRPAQHYVIKSGGQYFIYDSLEQVPEDMRDKVQGLDSDEGGFTVFVDGERKTYKKIQEVPKPIREALEKFDKQKK